MSSEDVRCSFVVDRKLKQLIQAAAGLWAAQTGGRPSEAAYMRAVLENDARKRIKAIHEVLDEG